MCGLAGIFTRQPLRGDQLWERADRMAARLVHRGPDDGGGWTDAEAGVAFGFRRLAIIDLSEQGHQPMRSRSGRFTLVFNGEVYNHPELRSELEADGCPFRGHSDTEVILAAFERWGIEAALQRFTGMFAMAIWDADARALSLVRDRLGIKPLYVHAGANAVLFGSELKALLAAPEFDQTLDLDALAAYFRYGFVPAPSTIFRGTIKLEPGTILTLRSPAGPLPAPVPYWSVREAAARGLGDTLRCNEAEAVDELERLLLRSVELRMRSDVPLGLLLSGGIDSSAVAALMQEVADTPVRTFCIGFDTDGFDESGHAATVARHLGTDHTEIGLTGADGLAVVPRIAAIFDEPFADPSQIPSLLVCDLARKDVTVALAGDGGDEVFGGYNRYTYGRTALARASRMPVSARRVAARALRAWSPGRWDRTYERLRPLLPGRLQERLVGDKLHKLAQLLEAPTDSARYRALLSAWPRPTRLVPGGLELQDAVDHAFADATVQTLVERMMLTDQCMYLPDDLLAKLDRVSMARSLEVRVPLLDHDVVEFSWRLPPELKVRGREGKWLLRRLLHRRVPAPLVERPKMGFSVPLDEWLRGPLRGWATELIRSDRLEEGGVLDAAYIRRAWQQFQVGNARLAPGLWAVLMFQSWRDQWSTRVAPADVPAVEAIS